MLRRVQWARAGRRVGERDPSPRRGPGRTRTPRSLAGNIADGGQARAPVARTLPCRRHRTPWNASRRVVRESSSSRSPRHAPSSALAPIVRRPSSGETLREGRPSRSFRRNAGHPTRGGKTARRPRHVRCHRISISDSPVTAWTCRGARARLTAAIARRQRSMMIHKSSLRNEVWWSYSPQCSGQTLRFAGSAETSERGGNFVTSAKPRRPMREIPGP